MAHAYTPGLKVLQHSKVRKDRRLPIKGEVSKKKGDHVQADHMKLKLSGVFTKRSIALVMKKRFIF